MPLAALLRRHLGGHAAVLVEIDGIVGHHLMLSPRRAPAGIIAAQGNRWPARRGRDTRMADPLRLMQAHAQQATGTPTMATASRSSPASNSSGSTANARVRWAGQGADRMRSTVAGRRAGGEERSAHSTLFRSPRS